MVVVNGVRRAPVGGSPEKQIRTALLRHAGVENPVLIPYDRAALDSSLAQGRALAEVAPNSLTRKAIRDLAAHLGGVPTVVQSGRPRGGARRASNARSAQAEDGRAAS